ncbi:putative sporulation protein YyaC [Paenibacillus uliginis N3/975]|uniref:Putative sporulation protein YyaC n=1 Tax=Paenibacillus uliginis N3/975 TaxID=1313296 RepID=A0A1X7GLV3_9BACL|nr:spore protease YyaC [Paenibacillus uliginis]SMF70968.1 putative sporulation protein YyaC [Paenibacillus uliginis N3/975]
MGDYVGFQQAPPVTKTKLSGEQLQSFFTGISQQHSMDQVTFLCIGTDRSTGDALGPLTGSRLLEYGFPHVIGTLSDPCDACNLETKLQDIPKGSTVIAIDACLGQSSSVSFFFGSAGPIHPAQSVGKPLPSVGHYSIAAVVNVQGPKPYWTLQVTSLHLVMTMAEEIAHAAASAFGLST